MDAKSKTYVTVYGDVTIVVPLLFEKVKGMKKEHKRLYGKRGEMLENLFRKINSD